MSKIIAVSGKIGSGKSTLCDIIGSMVGQHKILAFADDLKHIVSILCGLPIGSMYTEEGKNTFVESYGMTAGEMLQKIGTDVLRQHFDTDIWVKSLYNKIKEGDMVLIPDVRFPNEAQFLRDKGATLIRINGDPVGNRAKSKRDQTHPSETALDSWADWDLVIENDGTLEELKEKVQKFLTVNQSVVSFS